jgi:hypothetical protein
MFNLNQINFHRNLRCERVSRFKTLKAVPPLLKVKIYVMVKAASNKKNLFTSKLDLHLRKKLVKCYIWNIALYGAETWTLRKVDQKCLESLETWCCKRMEKTS